MKKIFGIIIALSMIFVVSTVYAEDQGSTKGEALTFTGENVGSGVPMTFTPSPTTSLLATTTDQAYTLLSWSANNLGEETGMVYLACSADGAVYQDKIGADAPDDAGTAGSTLTGFVQKK